MQAIEERVRKSAKKWIRIIKPDTCRLEEKLYDFTSEPERKTEPPVFVMLILFIKIDMLLILHGKSCMQFIARKII